LFPCGRLSWLMSTFERTLKISYRIVSYFEHAMINVFQIVFPGISQTDCFYHILSVSSNNTEWLRGERVFFVHSNAGSHRFCSRDGNPVSDSVDAFDTVIDVGYPDRAEPVVNYFEDNFIGWPDSRGNHRNPVFPITLECKPACCWIVASHQQHWSSKFLTMRVTVSKNSSAVWFYNDFTIVTDFEQAKCLVDCDFIIFSVNCNQTVIVLVYTSHISFSRSSLVASQMPHYPTVVSPLNVSSIMSPDQMSWNRWFHFWCHFNGDTVYNSI